MKTHSFTCTCDPCFDRRVKGVERSRLRRVSELESDIATVKSKLDPLIERFFHYSVPHNQRASATFEQVHNSVKWGMELYYLEQHLSNARRAIKAPVIIF